MDTVKYAYSVVVLYGDAPCWAYGSTVMNKQTAESRNI